VSDGPLVSTVRPLLAERLEAALRAQGHPELADQVGGLRVVSPCGCENAFCSSFYTGQPMKRWFRRGRSIALAGELAGSVSVDVVAGKIVYVEVVDLDRARAVLR
jgi:hypothetical protein